MPVVTSNTTQLTPQQVTLEKIQARMDKLGDLPVFSASVNRIRMMSSSEETEVTELATEITKDASLTTKLLRVANSPYYARGSSKVGIASRAVVMLGFDTVRSITLAMKVIDSFQYQHPQINMNSLLVKSYLSAGFVREIAFKSSVKDPEESYTCGLLHNMGEIIVAVTLPEDYLKMSAMVEQGQSTWEKAQFNVLGASMKQLAQELLRKWEFPGQVTQTVADFAKSAKGPVRNSQELNRALASYSAQVMDSLYTPNTSPDIDYQKLLLDLQEVSGLRGDALTECLSRSFKMSCDLAEQYGLDKKMLKPKMVGSGEDPRNKTARNLAYLVSAASGQAPVEAGAAETTPNANTPTGTDKAADTPKKTTDTSSVVRGDSGAFLNVLHDITMMITQKTDINAIFGKILEGIHRGVGFDHAMLCLMTPDRIRYKARFAVGTNADALKKYFSADVNVKTDLFSRVALNGEELLIKDAHDERWRSLLKNDFVTSTGAETFVVTALKLGEKSIGFFYADTSLSKGVITPELFRGFVQLVSQARIALSIRK
ncbi:MAG: HDOD domain-containing protein [Gammaproteobacteria bacterium]|nr:HDOD domain-containing protein [Gammaproteobacteria bacterium]